MGILMTDEKILMPIEAADLLGVALPTVYKWVHQRRIPFRKHGRRLLFSRSDLLKWSKANETIPLDNSY